jgi:hypothetical protein
MRGYIAIEGRISVGLGFCEFEAWYLFGPGTLGSGWVRGVQSAARVSQTQAQVLDAIALQLQPSPRRITA